MNDTETGSEPAGPRAGQPKRRTFTDAYKLAMVQAYDSATESGAKGALLRREGLYDSHIADWRKARDAGRLGAKHAGTLPPGQTGLAAAAGKVRRSSARVRS